MRPSVLIPACTLAMMLMACSPKPVAADNQADVVTPTVANSAQSPLPAPVPTATPTAAPTPAPTPDAPFNAQQLTTYPEAKDLPGEVQHFVARYQDCVHFMGEPDYDDARRAYLDEAVKELCTGIDAETARLRKKYAGDAGVTARLAEYDTVGL